MVAQDSAIVNILGILDTAVTAAIANTNGWEFKYERSERKLAQALVDLEQSQAALVACGERAHKAVIERDQLRALIHDMGEYRAISRAYECDSGGHVINMPAAVWHRFAAALLQMDRDAMVRT